MPPEIYEQSVHRVLELTTIEHFSLLGQQDSIDVDINRLIPQSSAEHKAATVSLIVRVGRADQVQFCKDVKSEINHEHTSFGLLSQVIGTDKNYHEKNGECRITDTLCDNFPEGALHLKLLNLEVAGARHLSETSTHGGDCGVL